MTVEDKLFYHHCCPNEPFSFLKFKLYMKRQYLFDVFNLILPYAIISAASIVELLLPVYVDSGSLPIYIILCKVKHIESAKKV